MRAQGRNEALFQLLKETRWTNHSFAIAVNGIGAESGVVLRYDRTAVSHWLAGSRPRSPVPELVAEVLSRRLGRFISPAEIGWADAASCSELPAGKSSGIRTVHELVMVDLDPQQADLRALPFQAVLAAAPAWTGEPQPRPGTVAGHGQAAIPSVINTMTSAFARADRMLGGGHARFAVAAYLASAVSARSQPDPAGSGNPAHLGAAAALTQLIGFMCFDNLHHRFAQHYYRAALQLAREADDAARYSAILHDMSTQAFFVGHYHRAVQLAEAAVNGAPASLPPESRAAVLGQAAACHAVLSHAKQTSKYLIAAEKSLLENGSPPDHGVLADLEHRTGLALAFLGQLGRAETALIDSLRHRPKDERRSRMLTTHYLAEVQLRRACPERACSTWQGFLREYPYIYSSRIDLTFDRFKSRLQEHRSNAAVRDVLHQAHLVAP